MLDVMTKQNASKSVLFFAFHLLIYWEKIKKHKIKKGKYYVGPGFSYKIRYDFSF